MTVESLWGSLDEIGEKPPVAHLREQATALGEITKNILYGTVYRAESSLTGAAVASGDLAFNLDVVAPAVGDYAYTVLQIRHRATRSYPVRIYTRREAVVAPAVVSCQDERSFLQALKRVLSSRRVQDVIQSLVSQSRALG